MPNLSAAVQQSGEAMFCLRQSGNGADAQTGGEAVDGIGSLAAALAAFATMGEIGVTPKQARFVAEYAKDCNATQAAIRAGYSKKTAYSQGQRLLKHVEVKPAVVEQQAVVLEEATIDAARVITELGRLATSDLSDCFDANGRLLPLHQIPKAARAAIAAVKVTKKNLTAGDGIVEDVIEVKLWEKGRALDTLAKHFGLLVDVNVNVNASLEQVAGVLQAARKRYAAATEGA